MQTVQRTTLTLAAALTLGLSSLTASAQPQPPQRHDGGPGYQQQHGGPGQWQRPGGPSQQQRPAQQMNDRHDRGAGPDHQWVRGSRMPVQYRSSHYVVNDWQRHGLKRPGRGQHWVQNGSDYLLVAIASGVIADLVIGR